MTPYDDLLDALRRSPRRWLVTGVAGFIGSNLLETLLAHGQTVIGLDNFSTGRKQNLESVRSSVNAAQYARFHLIEGDVCDPEACRRAAAGVDHVLHQAALGSVTRSIEDPATTNRSNVDGFLNVLTAARDARVRSFVYASSSSVYGDDPDLPKVESKIGKPLSPYAVTKLVNEHYAEVFARLFDFRAIGLRYFNVFGRRQDASSAYAAVIPMWIAAMIRDEPVFINGDGATSRDFCYVRNVVQANLLAAMTENPAACNEVYNVATHSRTRLDELYHLLREHLETRFSHLAGAKPKYRDFRPGDVRHSQANIDKARRLLGYVPAFGIADGLSEAIPWYVDQLSG